ncbi:MAG: preprotein translocase subunit SecG [Verrucomicrobia bacterium]|nr:preprotein translocase subunit SecG [Verrucomicrobiota bacterium]
MSILLGILTFLLILVSLFLVLVVLMQKSKDGGMGATLGGGMAEATFGAETGNVLTSATKWAATIFFVLALALYMGRIYERKHTNAAANNALPSIAAPAAPTAATPAPATAPITVNTGAAAATPAPATAAPATATPAPAEPAKKP